MTKAKCPECGRRIDSLFILKDGTWWWFDKDYFEQCLEEQLKLKNFSGKYICPKCDAVVASSMDEAMKLLKIEAKIDV